MLRLRAAQYLRMSTDHQQYSLEFQALTNGAFATAEGYELVRTYEDAGISGLTLEARPGLKQLLADVLAGQPGYEIVLVYDVSRWGRFQDPDEAAHYEFVCREAGVRIEYTAEPFANDGSLTATLVKSLKRAMAAEYSRELSTKVAAAKRRAQARGYWGGGPVPFGLRRQVVDRNGSRGAILKAGEHKMMRGYHTVLVHGPPEEVETVRRIFRTYIVEGLKPYAIADRLNAQGVRLEDGRDWCSRRVRRLLSNEAYIGVIVGGRTATTFSRKRATSSADWIRTENALPPIISREDFDLTQAHLRHKPKVSDEAMLEELRAVWAQEGRLTQRLIREARSTRSLSTYQRRFGTSAQIYSRLGYTPSRGQLASINQEPWYRPYRWRRPHLCKSAEQLVADLRRLLAERGHLSVLLINDAPYCSAAQAYSRGLGGMRRAYALAGYTPKRSQELSFERRGRQSLTAAQAASLREQVLAARPGGEGEKPRQHDRDDEDAPSSGLGFEPA